MLPTPIPTLYLHGRDDGCFALEAIGNPLDFLAQGSEVVVVDDAGHFLNVEQPELFNRHVLDFIAP
jgi:pimeloyl-ACP methyl ester carboxylesterase